jgi:hypothetical protein
LAQHDARREQGREGPLGGVPALAERGWGKPTNLELIVDDGPAGREGLNLDLKTIDREIARLTNELGARDERPGTLS